MAKSTFGSLDIAGFCWIGPVYMVLALFRRIVDGVGISPGDSFVSVRSAVRGRRVSSRL